MNAFKNRIHLDRNSNFVGKLYRAFIVNMKLIRSFRGLSDMLFDEKVLTLLDLLKGDEKRKNSL